LWQIGKSLGAYVIAVCSGKNADLVRGAGADEVRLLQLPVMIILINSRFFINMFTLIMVIIVIAMTNIVKNADLVRGSGADEVRSSSPYNHHFMLLLLLLLLLLSLLLLLLS
jgi:hypothetical protein